MDICPTLKMLREKSFKAESGDRYIFSLSCQPKLSVNLGWSAAPGSTAAPQNVCKLLPPLLKERSARLSMDVAQRDTSVRLQERQMDRWRAKRERENHTSPFVCDTSMD